MLRVDAAPRLRHRPPAGAAGLLARARRPPSRRSPRRCSPTPTSPTPASPRASTTRSRASPACSPSRRSARSSPRQFISALDQRLAGQRSRRPARAAVEQARKETLARVDPRRLPGGGSRAVESASVHAFHVGIGISASLVALGGVLGLAGIRNPRRAVRCEDCPGGQFAGQPLDAALRQAPGPLAQGGHGRDVSGLRHAC